MSDRKKTMKAAEYYKTLGKNAEELVKAAEKESKTVHAPTASDGTVKWGEFTPEMEASGIINKLNAGENVDLSNISPAAKKIIEQASKEGQILITYLLK